MSGEKDRVIFLDFCLTLGKKGSGFYDLPWGRGVLVSVAGLWENEA
jgi:hypothetical protein